MGKDGGEGQEAKGSGHASVQLFFVCFVFLVCSLFVARRDCGDSWLRRHPLSQVKITIRSLPKAQKQDAAWAQKTWGVLKNALTEIYHKNASALSFEELYRSSYNLVMYKFADLLYRNITETVKGHLEEVAKPVEVAHDDVFLEVLNSTWNDHRMSMNCVRDILLYMDRTYVPTANVLPVYDLGLKLFLQVVVQQSRVRERLSRILLNWIQRERSGEMIQRGVFKNMVQMLVDLGLGSRSVYESEFETRFLETSVKFYAAESRLYMSSNTVSDYMKKVERRMHEEAERIAVYLDSQTDARIKDVLEKELILANMEWIVETGVTAMMAGDALSDLALMYRLLGRVRGGLDLMRRHVADYVEVTGKELVTSDTVKSKDVHNEFVQALLTLKNRVDVMLTECFGSDKNFQKDIGKAFEKFANINDRTPQYLSLFVDEQLTKGLKVSFPSDYFLFAYGFFLRV